MHITTLFIKYTDSPDTYTHISSTFIHSLSINFGIHFESGVGDYCCCYSFWMSMPQARYTCTCYQTHTTWSTTSALTIQTTNKFFGQKQKKYYLIKSEILLIAHREETSQWDFNWMQKKKKLNQHVCGCAASTITVISTRGGRKKEMIKCNLLKRMSQIINGHPRRFVIGAITLQNQSSSNYLNSIHSSFERRNNLCWHWSQSWIPYNI